MDISARINRRLESNRAVDDYIDGLLEMAISPARFDGAESLREHLHEGALLNVGKIASDCLSIPSGNYMVWLTDAGRTVLVPAPAKSQEVYHKSEDKYELHTAKLLGMWNKLQRSLVEDDQQGGQGQAPEQQGQSGHFGSAPEAAPEEPYTFGADVGRPALWQAMQRAGVGVSDLADRVGVDKSTISRLLRDVKRGPGDPHGRNPSVAVAQQIASVLGVDVSEVLPPPEDLDVSRRSSTSGSGAGGGKNSQQMTQGGNGGTAAAAAQESTVRALATGMVECNLDPVRFITESLIGVDGAERTINEFLFGMGRKSAAAKDKLNGEKLFDTAINAINGLIKAYGRVQGAGGFTARVGDKKIALDSWLAAISHNLNKIKVKMPEVQQKKLQAAQSQASSKAVSQRKPVQQRLPLGPGI